MLTRGQFQDLAQQRVGDAEALLSARRFAGAYYFSGLAVECALKACIARQTGNFEFPDLNRAKSSHTHDLGLLLKTAELSSVLEERMDQSRQFTENWNTVKQWKIDSRYDPVILELPAQNLFSSVTEQDDGVLSWLRTVW